MHFSSSAGALRRIARSLAVVALMAACIAAAPSPTAASVVEPFTAAQAQTAVQALRAAGRHGLDPARFGAEALAAQLDPRGAAPGPVIDQRLWAALVEYARSLHSGALSRGALPADWAVRPAPYDPEPGLSEALKRDDLARWLASLPPQTQAYAGLQQALARYGAYAEAGGWPAVAAGRPPKLGDKDPRMPVLRRRLLAEGEVLQPGEDPVFDAELQAALAHFQRLHGVSDDGVLGPETLRALNMTAQARLGQILANLERMRWAPRALAATRLEVDSGSATLSFYRNGLLALSMRTIVGRPGDPTPMFSDQVEAVVLNPPWNVPPTIAAKEIMPKARADGGYLARNDFIFVQDGAGVRLQQKAGPKSALGLYKFDMPNGFNVYLHDTPARTLFEQDKRNLSHGCIRLQKPRELAELILGDDQGMGPEAIAAAVEAGATRRIVLRRPIPVVVAHWTVSASGETVAFRPDVYGWDAKLAALLAAR